MNRTLMIAMALLPAVVVSCKDTDGAAEGPGDGRSAESETIQLLVPKRTLERGDEIDPKDLRVVHVETHFREGLGSNVIVGTTPDELAREILTRRVQRGMFLRWEDLVGHIVESPSEVLDRGMEAFILKIEPGVSPGQLLRPGDRVVVIGVLGLRGKAPKTYRIIEGVKVVSVGGVRESGVRDGEPTAEELAAMKNYTHVAIQVDAKTATQLHNVITHVVGSLRINILSPKDKGNKYVDPIPINPDLRDIAPVVPAGGDPAGGEQ